MSLDLPLPEPSAVPADARAPLSFIVLSNFFPAARRAVRYAAELAAPLGAQLVLLHVREATVLEGELLPDSPEREGDLLMAVQTLADEVYVPTSVELVGDLQLPTARALARQYAPALFVLGRAADEDDEHEVGPAVLEVLRSGQFPLLLVPETYPAAAPIDRVLLAADGDAFNLDQPAAALRLLGELRPSLTVATVSLIDDDLNCAAALRHAKANGLTEVARHTTLQAVRHAYPWEGLLQTIDATRADLLVLVARRHSFLDAMFHRSVTNRLLRTSPVPVLVLPALD
ncbi:universal stress protein [Hymenobacter sp. B81]|uniref:universal stress protein n=1 Tax=Hymenobacter sp. B81 TaxID=3344878 RepID=UPI0037DC92D1